MYALNQEQIDSIESFIGKLEDSLIKSRVEKWLAEVEPTERVTSEQLEQFVAFATHLPKELQAYPQELAHWLKNGENTDRMEHKMDVAEPVDFAHEVNESIANVPDVDAPENKEETLHKLNTKHGSKGGKKISKTAKETTKVSKSKKKTAKK